MFLLFVALVAATADVIVDTVSLVAQGDCFILYVANIPYTPGPPYTFSKCWHCRCVMPAWFIMLRTESKASLMLDKCPGLINYLDILEKLNF